MKKKIFLILLVAVIVVSNCTSIISMAVERKNVDFNFSTNFFSEEEQRMKPQTSFKAADTVYVGISVSEISGIGGFTLKIKYDASKVSFDASKVLYFINDNKSEYLTNDNSGELAIVWETYNSNTTLSGLIFYLPFSVKDSVVGSQSALFTPEIVEVFESNAAQTTINAASSGAFQIDITSDEIPESFIAKVNSIAVGISYNPNNDPAKPQDSLELINETLEDYKKLTIPQKNAFINNYSELYDVLSNALNRYYALASDEKGKLAKEEAQKFLNKFESLLQKNESQLTLENDEELLTQLETEYPVLSNDAKQLLSESQKTKIAQFIQRLALLKEEENENETAAQEVTDFLTAYGSWISDQNYENTLDTWSIMYTNDGANIIEAIVMYGFLSAKAQNELKTYKERCDELQRLSLEYAEDAEVEAEIQDGIAEFTSNYFQAFTLNSATVSVNDKSLIEMVIFAYDNMEEGAVKERLSGRISSLKNLLTVIAQLEEIPTSDSTNTSLGTSLTPQKEVVTETVTKETVKWKNKLYTVNSEIGLHVKMALIIFALSIVCVAASIAVLHKVYDNKFKGDE